MFAGEGPLNSATLFATKMLRVVIDVAPLAIGLLAFFLVRQYVQRRSMPPGPRGVPFIGNKHQVPSIKPWRKFAEWNKQYGAHIVFYAEILSISDLRWQARWYLFI